MSAGLSARLDRISTAGRYLIVPMDHGITMGAVSGLKNIEATVDGVTDGGADAVLTQKGVADRVHGNTNGSGYIVHVNGSTTIGPDENDKRLNSFEHVCESTSLPVVIAGGSKGTDRETVEMVRGAMDAGAAGVSMGRSIFQHDDPEAITRAVSAVVHDDHDPEDALSAAGLTLEA